MKNEHKIFLRIHNFDSSIEEITNQLGIKPSKAWLKGDLIENRKKELKRLQSTWEYRSILGQEESVDMHIDHILSLVYPKKHLIKKLSTKYEGEISIVIYETESSNIGLNFDVDLIKKIYEMGL